MTPRAHATVMVTEVLEHARPRPGDVVMDCTVGDGGHAQALLERVLPGGRLIGLDVDPNQLARAGARLREAGFASDAFRLRHESFARLPAVLAGEGLTAVDVIVADLGVSSVQFDDPRRGLNYKSLGPLDMRLDPASGEPASDLIARLGEAELADLLERHADEPHAAIVARLLEREGPSTSHGVARAVRSGLAVARPDLPKQAIKDSIRRTFQALRMEVNSESPALDALLAALPACLAADGRVVAITFHVGEERRVKEAFQAYRLTGVFSQISEGILRPSRPEILANRRSSSARLHWAVRSRGI